MYGGEGNLVAFGGGRFGVVGWGGGVVKFLNQHFIYGALLSSFYRGCHF